MAQPTIPAKYPTGGQYVDALQHPALAFADAQLRTGTVTTDPLGMPRPVSGNFASVFQITTHDGCRWAVKCFTRSVADQQQRYHAISAALRDLHHPALVDFDYQPAGLLVSGTRYPLLKMRWVDAQGLLPWLELHRTEPARLTVVAGQLVSLVNALEDAGIAHGDLQHGNLLVTPGDDLVLIDYDGMYVPALAGSNPTEKGLANYQHPLRDDHHFGPGLDRFAGWVIYTSLLALAVDPSLWRRLRASDDDTKLLFGASDYQHPTTSAAIAALRGTGNPQLLTLADSLATFARVTLRSVPRLDPAQVLGNSPTPLPGQGQPTHATPSETPDWLVDHLPPTPAGTTQSEVPAQPAPAPTTAFGPGFGRTAARLAAVSSAIASICAALKVIGMPVLGVIPLMAWIAIAVIAAVTTTVIYRRHPKVAARNRARIAYGDSVRVTAAAQAALDTLQGEIGNIELQRREHQQAIASQRTSIVQRRQAAEQAAGQQLQTQLAYVQAQRSIATNGLPAMEAARLEQLRNEHVQRALASATIAKNPPPQIDTKIVAALVRSGFRTAADFVGFHTVSGGRYPKTYLRRTPTDYGAYVEQVGAKRAQNLMDWRTKIQANAQRAAPTQLTAEQRRVVIREYQQRLEALQRQEDTARATARTAMAAARTMEQQELSDLDRRQHQIDNELTSKHNNLKRRLGGAEREHCNAQALQARRHDEAASYHGLTLLRFNLPTS